MRNINSLQKGFYQFPGYSLNPQSNNPFNITQSSFPVLSNLNNYQNINSCNINEKNDCLPIQNLQNNIGQLNLNNNFFDIINKSQYQNNINYLNNNNSGFINLSNMNNFNTMGSINNINNLNNIGNINNLNIINNINLMNNINTSNNIINPTQNVNIMNTYNIKNINKKPLRKAHSSRIKGNADLFSQLDELNLDSSGNINIDQCKKKIISKKSSLFKLQDETHKERDLRDFKRLCDGLKYPLPEYICSQIGSRVMQKYLQIFPSFIRKILIEKISDSFEKIMCNTYGNYFFQKLYSISTEEERKMILYNMKDIFITVSKNSSGAHVTQSIIEEANSIEEKKIIMDYIKGHELEMTFHCEGTHVLQKVIQIFTENDRQSLIDVLTMPDNVFTLSQNVKGIPVLKRLISFTQDPKNKMKLIDAMNVNCLEIAQNSSGNYIIQYLLEKWGIEISFKLVQFCVKNSEQFAVQKYSSKVIYKIIELCTKKLDDYMSISDINIKENGVISLLKDNFFNNNKIINIYKNKYGKSLLIKLRKLFTLVDKERLLIKIKELENTPNYQENKKYQIFVELYDIN